MRAAAKLDGIGTVGFRAVQAGAHGHDTNLIAIFFTEQRHRTLGNGVINAHQAGDNRRVLQDDFVRHLLDHLQLLGRHRLRMRNVEAQALGRDQRTLLGDVRAEHLAQRLVQQVGGGVVGAQTRTTVMIDRQLHGFVELQSTLGNGAQMHEQAFALFLGVGNGKGAIVAGDHAGIAHLATGLAIKRCLVDDDLYRLALGGAVHRLAVLDDRLNDAFGGFSIVTEEFGRAELFLQFEPDGFGRLVAGAGPVRASFRLLALHGVGEAGNIDADLTGAQRILRQIERETIGVVKLEGGFAVQHVALVQGRGGVGEKRQAAFQGLAETGFLKLQRFGNQRLGANQFRIGAAHLLHECRQQLVDQRLARAEKFGMAHGATHDAAQDITAAFIGRQDAIGDQEGGRAQMVGDDPVAGALFTFGRNTGRFHGSSNQRAEQIRIVIVVLALQQRGNTLKTHAGVD
ncbi:hypothetical protein D3C71_613170 [compost metagenome]